MSSKLLIVEDNIAESIYAQGDAIKAGFKDFKVASNLEEALSRLPEADVVISDLFFPVGNASIETYVNRFLPVYENYKKEILENKDYLCIGRAVKQCAQVYNVTAEEYVEDYMTKMDTIPFVLKAARDAIKGLKNAERYERIEQDIRNGVNLPLGIIVTEKAKELGIPSVIVTSTYHHDLAFEPVSRQINAKYFDNLIDGRKDWISAMNYIKD